MGRIFDSVEDGVGDAERAATAMKGQRQRGSIAGLDRLGGIDLAVRQADEGCEALKSLARHRPSRPPATLTLLAEITARQQEAPPPDPDRLV